MSRDSISGREFLKMSMEGGAAAMLGLTSYSTFIEPNEWSVERVDLYLPGGHVPWAG